MAMVSAGEADLAAIDAVTLALLRAVRPDALAALRVLGWTADAPGLPLITAQGAATGERLHAALRSVARDPAVRPVLAVLRIEGFAVLPDDAYARIGALARQAAEAGYPVLR